MTKEEEIEDKILSEITNIAEYVEVITALTENNDYNYFYRGQKKNYHEDYNVDENHIDTNKQIRDTLKPSLFRGFKLIENEHVMFREFILRNPNDFKDEKTTFEKLVKMQHYGLPTRLLDITSNALIALYFACEGDSKDHGFVSVFRIKGHEIKFYDSDTVSVISNIAKRPAKNNDENFTALDLTELVKLIGKPEKAKKHFDKKGLRFFNKCLAVQYLLHEIKDEKPYFKDCIKYGHLNQYYYVKPFLNNRRIIRQDGAFLLFGMGNTKFDCPKIKDDIGIIKIKKDKKSSILKQLEQLGISKDKVYPEMDKVAEYLKDKYTQ